jgi:prepilin peptidase CpaA
VTYLMTSAQFVTALAGAVAVTAAVVDVKERRIPNWLTYSAMIAGIVLQGVFHGLIGILNSVEGGLLFGGIFMLFYVVRAMGAGDVKLAAALGFLVGPSASFRVMFATAIAGGLLAIVIMVFTGRVRETLGNTFAVVFHHAHHGLNPHPMVNLQNPKAARMPYGLAFAAGTLYWSLVPVFWR